MPVDFSVTNQLASPAIYASSFATRPAASFKGRLFVDTDNPSSGIYRDTGTAWIAIAGTSVGEIQSLNDVCVVGNSTTTLGINIFGITAIGQAGGIQITPQASTALTIGDNFESAESLYVAYNAIFNTTAQVNTSLTTPLLIGGTTTTSTLTYRTTSAAGITGARHIFQVGNNGATEAMTILNNANVGIGNTNPLNGVGFGLQITSPSPSAAYVRINYIGFTGLDIIQGGDGTGYLYLRDNNDLRFGTNNSEKLRLFANGNIAINSITDAGYKLDVNGTGNFSGALTGTSATFSGSVIVGTTALLNFGPTTSFVGMSGNNSTGALALYANNTQVLGFAASTGVATFSGTLAVGTTSPNASALIDITSTTKGVLLPRMTTTEVNAIVTPANGLLVYNTTIDHFCGYQAGAWVKFNHSPM